MKGHSISGVQISHVALDVHAPYDRFSGALEKIAGRFDKDVEQDILSNPRRAEERIKAMTVVEYDQPSSLFGQFENPEVTPVGVALDTRLERVIARAAELSR